MIRRLHILKHTLLHRHLGGGAGDWLFNTFSPRCETLAAAAIEETEERDGMMRVRLKGRDGWLYAPIQLGVHAFYQTITEQWYPWQWHYYTIPQTAVAPGDVVFDCGAAEGIFTFLHRGTAGHLYAFEPLPEFRAGLEKTFAGDARVTVVPSALGAVEDTAYLRRNGIASTLTTEPTDTTVRIETVDGFCRRQGTRVDFIKADVEGYEIEILRGAAEAIREFRPKIAVTTYHNAGDAREVEEFLRATLPEYRILRKGIEERAGAPVMVHAWVDR